MARLFRCLACQKDFKELYGVQHHWVTSPDHANAGCDVLDADAAIKKDEGKNRLELLPILALEETGKVLTLGAKKYADHNWRKGFDWSRLEGACMRHLTAFMRGEDYDPESGLLHLAHLNCEVMFLLEHQLAGYGKDDRKKVWAAARPSQPEPGTAEEYSGPKNL